MIAKIVPVLLSGGGGTRLWPVSSVGVPKPFLPLVGGRSTFAATLGRIADRALFAEPMVVARTEHRRLIANELAANGTSARLVLEPEAMSTTAAIAAAAAAVDDADALLLFLAADHVIRDESGFRDAVATARPAVEAGRIVIFGIEPDSPQTGYGYIRPGAKRPGAAKVSDVSAFVEKPTRDRAETLIAEGCLWNSGYFFARAATVLAEIDRLAPVTAKAAKAAVAEADRHGDAILLAREPFITAEPISFDHAVLEKTDRAAVVAARFDWADVGTWASIRDLSDHDDQGNVIVGNAALIDTRNSLVRTDGPRIGVIGLSDTLVVAANGAVLVAPLAEAGGVRDLATAFSGQRAGPAVETIFDSGPGYRIARLVIGPGARHSARIPIGHTDHWTVVSGRVDLTIDDGAVRALTAGQSVILSSSDAIDVLNPGDGPATIATVRHGESDAVDGTVTGHAKGAPTTP